MAAMDVYNITACKFGHVGSLRIGICYHVHHVLVHFDDFVSVKIRLHWAGSDDITALRQKSAFCAAAGVGQFDGSQRSPLMYGVNGLNQGRKKIFVIQMRHGWMGMIGQAMHACLTQRYNTGAAPGNGIIHFIRLSGIEWNVAAGGHGCRLNTVLDVNVAHTDRRKQMWIMGHIGLLFSKMFSAFSQILIADNPGAEQHRAAGQFVYFYQNTLFFLCQYVHPNSLLFQMLFNI